MKFEIRISKSETIRTNIKIRMTKTLACLRFALIWIWFGLFRISIFGFRIYPGMRTSPRSEVYRLTVAYDGTAYGGWQRQPNQRSIQELLEAAVEKVAAHTLTLTPASNGP